ncbi:hypothetical protein [Sporosarcina cyprini]|uniref:hypothetical protein n=1 Tax=Sporosarcina cyprini TaxID=2910523 RepID=UPI001EDDBAD9|nr:hypothetical protein [Sporosarcina cyprini]MCG3089429.1 hypothetical protein [Sporosarcina cyprini]
MKKVILGVLLTAMLMGCSKETKVVEEKRDVSQIFEIPVTFGYGTKGEYILIGEKGKLGFLVGSEKEGEAEAQPIIAEKSSKYMWYFWGDKKELK